MGFKRVLNSRIAAVGAGAAVLAVLAGGVGYAAGEINSKDIQNDSIRSVDVKDDSLKMKDFTNGVQKKIQGEPVPAGQGAMPGAVYRVAKYANGGGGRATVACADDNEVSQRYTAIAGGARVEVPGAGTNTEDITSSFPGRMDWDTNLPKPDRLDGWVVYFGDGAAPNADEGNVLEVWALCVPTTKIPVQVNTY
jgi:hypothetical protein